MSGPRGEYRSLSVVMLDGPQYRALSERARHILLVARMSLGPSAIRAMPGFFGLLSDRTGMPIDAVQSAWHELQVAGWAYHDGVVAWIVRGLDFEASLRVTDSKHRTNLREHVAGLPRTALVGSFVKYYAAWWQNETGHPVAHAVYPAPSPELAAWIAAHATRVSDVSPKGPRGPFGGPSKPLPSTESESKTEREEQNTPRAREFLNRVSASASEYVADIVKALRGAPDLDLRVAEYVALENGMHGPNGAKVPLPVLGLAIRDMLNQRKDPTGKVLRVFVADLMKTPVGRPAASTSSPGQKVLEMARKRDKEQGAAA